MHKALNKTHNIGSVPFSTIMNNFTEHLIPKTFCDKEVIMIHKCTVEFFIHTAILKKMREKRKEGTSQVLCTLLESA